MTDAIIIRRAMDLIDCDWFFEGLDLNEIVFFDCYWNYLPILKTFPPWDQKTCISFVQDASDILIANVLKKTLELDNHFAHPLRVMKSIVETDISIQMMKIYS